MNDYALFEQRYGLAVPRTYRQLQAQGHFDYRREPADWLGFYDCEWLLLEGIANYEFNAWEIAADKHYLKRQQDKK